MSNLRQVWFVTRPERDPKFHKEALQALQIATDDFKLKWAKNRELHKKYEKVLNNMGIKRNNVSNDGSGGRTWVAMLKTFAYCYVNEEGYIILTKVGKSILKGHKVFENIKKQILTLQIPNAYFLETGFRPKFDPEFQIRPARFLIKLTNQQVLDYYLTKEEITFFALNSKKDEQLKEITEKIISFRKANHKEKEMMKQNASKNDHRQRTDKLARSFETAHSDVAHTFMLLCDYTGLVEYIRGEALRVDPDLSENVAKEINYYDDRYPFNKRYMISLERMAESNGLDVDSYKASSYGTIKPATNKNKTKLKLKQLLEPFPDLSVITYSELEEILYNEFPPREVEKIKSEFIKEFYYSELNSDFVESYLTEKDNLAFEDKTGNIFEAIGFDVVMRPKPLGNENTEIEILLKYGNKTCGIIDSKNYKKKFTLSAGLVSHMASEYIPNYDGYEGRKVEFFGYVTASDFGGERNIAKITEKAKKITGREIKGIMISAKALLGYLDYCIENNLSKEERIDFFLKAIDNSGYNTPGQILRKVIEK